MHKPSFDKTPLAKGVALALGATIGVPVVAQGQEVVEEVVVTGIRGSLMQSMDIKRQADGVVDAISAEDIGDFPDRARPVLDSDADAVAAVAHAGDVDHGVKDVLVRDDAA